MNVTLLSERSKSVRSLSGFEKTHKEPDRVTASAQAFVARAASKEIANDIECVFVGLKSAFKFKRAELQATKPGDGTATIRTPNFSYSVTVALHPDDPSQVIFRRTVDALRDLNQLASPAFVRVFESAFDTVVCDTPRAVDLAELVDRVEALEDDRIRVDYDPDLTHCHLRIQGVAGTINVTRGAVSIVHTRPQSPAALLESYRSVWKLLQGEGDFV